MGVQVKATLLGTGVFDEGVPLHITSGLGAGFFAVVCGSPVDVVKSRMMGMPRSCVRVNATMACAPLPGAASASVPRQQWLCAAR